MEITLNHTIVPSHHHIESAKFYCRIFDFEYVKEWGHFAVVKVNSSLTLDFMNQEIFSSIHYAFKVSEPQFDEILARINSEKICFGSAPNLLDNGTINHNNGGRGLYLKDSDGHILEMLTQDYVLN